MFLIISGCYTSYQKSMDQFVMERAAGKQLEFKIESVILSDSTAIIFNKDMATFYIDQNIISGIDVNNIKHNISVDELILVNINNHHYRNLNYQVLTAIVIVFGSIYLIDSIKL
jgi:hypothetical protein